MLGMLKAAGLDIVTDRAAADVIIVNTCGFLESAAKESVDEILGLAEYKEKRCRMLIVAGCLTQRYKGELERELSEVDCFIGTGEYHKIADVVKNGPKERVMAGISTYVHDYSTPRILSTPSHFAYVKIAEGCSNLCSYCTIPSIRGAFRSRTIDSVVREAEDLAKAGVKEINLIAQDITSFGRDLKGADLPKLVRSLAKVGGIEWIRLLYLYPSRITDGLIKVIRDEDKVCKYIDMPVQHISTRVLKAMNRSGTKTGIKDVIKRIRRAIPDVTLRTSIIAGFPGETEKEFKELLTFVEETGFERLGVFKYSKEDGTPAARLSGQLTEKVKAARFRRLMGCQKKISLKKNKALIGSTIKVLIEAKGSFDGYSLVGRASTQAPEVDGVTYIKEGSAAPGDIVEARVKNVSAYDLMAEIA